MPHRPALRAVHHGTFVALAGLLGLVLSGGAGAAEPVRPEPIVIEAPFPMPPITPPAFPAVDFPITAYGGVAGSDATEAIRKAIAACHDAGGGRVVVPAGAWRTGAIHFQSGVNLVIESGATLTFDGDPARYLPAVRSSWEGFECYNYSPLIYAYDCDQVALTGGGTIEAEMTTWTTWMKRPPAHMEALKALYTMAATGVPVEQRQMTGGEEHLRPHFIQFNRCRNVLIEGLTIRNSPFWTTHLLLCDGVIVRGLDISAHGMNNDGIDPEATRNLLIERCRFDQGDDAIAIKSGSNHDGWRLNTPTENVVIRDCTVALGHQLVAIGSELSGGIRNVSIHDCRFLNDDSKVRNLLFIKTNIRRGGFVENIFMDRIQVASTGQSILSIDTDVMYQFRTLVPTYEERLTRIKGIHVSRIQVRETGGIPFRIAGDARLPVEDVFLEDIRVGTAHGAGNAYVHALNVQEKAVEIGTIAPARK